MKTRPAVRSLIAGFAALFVSTQNVLTQTPTPSISPGRCPLPGWAEGLVKYTDPATPFPTKDTQNSTPPGVDCIFHQWSWEAFVWATAFIECPGVATKQPRFLCLPNLDGLNNPTLAKSGPKPLVLKPRTLKRRGAQQDPNFGFQQAGSQGVIIDQTGQAVWYSVHANETYFQFAQKYYGVAAFQKASATMPFPVGAAVFKASWQIVPEGQTPPGVFTTSATVPMLINNPSGSGIMVDPSGKTRSVTVALVGLHVVGVTVNHPEFLWGTFEQIQNAPDLTQPNGPVNPNNFTFYKGGTAAADCNQQATESVSNPTTQTLAPITNLYRQFATGGESTLGTQEITSINSQSQGAVKAFPNNPAEAVWSNYKLIGTVWTKPNTLVPGDGNMDTEAVGSVSLANATLETYVQGAGQNCFLCHNTSAFAGANTAKDIALSHKLQDPFFTQSAKSAVPPKASPTPKK
ncbi:MAG: hypothetical protein QOJ45_1727 [Verrucomicrobiota bacterium]|jgi:hypothetical protein